MVFRVVCFTLTLFLSFTSFASTDGAQTDPYLLTGYLMMLMGAGLLGLSGVIVKQNLSQKRLQAQYDQQQELMQSLLSNLPDVMVLKDEKGKFLLCNETVARLYGTTPEQMIGKDDADFGVPQEFADAMRSNVLDIMARGEAEVVLEESTDNKTGEVRHFKSTKIPFKDLRGDARILVIAHDITDIVKAQKQLAENENKLRTILDNVDAYIFLKDTEGRYLFANQPVCDLWQTPLDQIMGHSDADFFDAEMTSQIQAHDRRVLDQGETLSGEERGKVLQTGKSAIYKVTKLPLRTEDGLIYALCGISVDITAQKRTEEALRESEQRFKLAGKVAYDLIYERDVEANGLRWFGDIDAILGFDRGVISSNVDAWLGLIHPDDVDQLEDAVELHRHSTSPINFHYRVRHQDGHYRYWSDQALPLLNEAGKPYKWIGVCTDVTVLQEQQNQLEHAAYHDRLTGLPNRGLLADRLHQAISQLRRREQMLAVVYIDLDGFKEINDQFGHDVGDQLLVTIAHRFREVLREGDTIARLGGDEFVAVLIDLTDKTAALPMLNRIQRAITQPITVDDKVLTVSASMGVTFCPQEETVEADQLIRQADQAMYQAKMAGKNGYHLFDTEHENSLIGQRDVIQSVQKALQQQEFELFYQPKVDMHSGEVLGAEALIRWHHPERGLLYPAEFLPMVEDHPLAIELGDWVIDTALAQVNQWFSDDHCIPVSINISAQQMLTSDFISRLQRMLDKYPELDHSLIELEILETSALQDITRVSQVMRQCEAMGISFALDDFGTGYSSLNYLKHLPAKTMKIDRSFVRDMLKDADDMAILDGVIGMSSAFRRHIIAEGVEDEKQGQLLLQLGCSRAQGYAIAKPMPADQLPGWIKTWVPPVSWMQQTRINREDLSFLFAAVEHRAWVQAMADYMDDSRSAPPELEHTDCRFGFWLENSTVKERIPQSVMAQILNLHHKIHQSGKALVNMRASGNAAEIKKELSLLYASSAELQECIQHSIEQPS